MDGEEGRAAAWTQETVARLQHEEFWAKTTQHVGVHDHRAYHAAVGRVGDPTARLAYTPRRVLRALHDAGPSQTADSLREHLTGVVPTASTVRGALYELEVAGLATQHAAEDGTARWSATEAPRCDALGDLKLRGPHDLRHTFLTWLEDAGIPPRVIDELMGHAGGRRGGGEADQRGSPVGLRYCWTTPEMEARVVAAIKERLVVALKIADQQRGYTPTAGEGLP